MAGKTSRNPLEMLSASPSPRCWALWFIEDSTAANDQQGLGSADDFAIIFGNIYMLNNVEN